MSKQVSVPLSSRLLEGLNRGRTLSALVLLLAFNAIATRDFFSLQTLSVNLSQVAPVVVVALGMALVVAAAGIDLSVGAVAACAGTLAAVMLSAVGSQGVNGVGMLTLAMVLALIVASGLGLVNALLIARYGVQPIVATLVLFIAGRGFAEMMTGGNLRTFPAEDLSWLRNSLLGLPAQAYLMLLAMLMVGWVVRYSLFGRRLLAVGGNERAAQLSGIPVARVKCIAYMACALLAGVAGIMNVAMTSAADPAKIGLNLELDAIAAVAVGGTSLAGGQLNVAGTLLGAFVIQLLDYTLLAHGMPYEYALVAKAAIIFAAVYLQSRGK